MCSEGQLFWVWTRVRVALSRLALYRDHANPRGPANQRPAPAPAGSPGGCSLDSEPPPQRSRSLAGFPSRAVASRRSVLSRRPPSALGLPPARFSLPQDPLFLLRDLTQKTCDSPNALLDSAFLPSPPSIIPLWAPHLQSPRKALHSLVSLYLVLSLHVSSLHHG